MQENPGYLKLRKIRAAQSIANTVSPLSDLVSTKDSFFLYVCVYRYLNPRILSISMLTHSCSILRIWKRE